MNSKKDQLIIFLMAFGLLIGIIALVSLISGTLLKFLGISYTSIWYFILYMMFVTIVSYPLSALVLVFIKVLLLKELIHEKTAIIAFIVMDTIATFTSLNIVDMFMDSVTMTPLAMLTLGLVFALLSLPKKKKKVVLKELDNDTKDLDIKLRIHQEQYVLSVQETLMIAGDLEDSKLLGIYSEDNLIGLALYHVISEKHRYVLSQLMIDKRFQAKGFGEVALRGILEMMKKENKYPVVSLCCHIDNIAAINLYQKFGFRKLSINEEEVIMELYLDDYNIE